MRFVTLAIVSFAAVSHAAPEVAPSAPGNPFPANGGSLPLNGRVLFFGEDLPGTTFVRDGADVLAFETLPFGFERPELAFIVDPGALVASADVAVEPQCAGCFGQAASFTVIDFVDETPPVFANGPPRDIQVSTAGTVNLFGIEDVISHDVSATLPLLSDDGGPVLVRTESDEGIVELDASDTLLEPIAPSVRMSFSPGPARRACFDVFAVDVAGNETAFPTPICADIGDGGCAQTSPSHALTLAVLALLVRRRRAR